jgi:glycine hydroxymethyltransferase
MNDSITRLSKAFQGDAYNRINTINLVASENVTSECVRKTLSHPCYDYYHFSAASEKIQDDYWLFYDNSFIKDVRSQIKSFSEELLKSSIIDPRPKGGQCAQLATLLGIACRDDIVFYVGEEDGGHYGLSDIAKIAGILLIPIIFNQTDCAIDIEKTLRKIKDTSISTSIDRCKGLILGQSFTLRKEKLAELCLAIKASFPNMIITFDASHTLGLIMGNKYPQPLLSGVDILHANTHKTFPGPQKGIIVFSETLDVKVIQTVSDKVVPTLQSNSGTSEILSLAVAFLEMQLYSVNYAKNICENAKLLAEELYNKGFEVVGKHFGFTETHQVLLKGFSKTEAIEGAARLISAGIKVNPAIIPFTNSSWGIRIGTASITRRGISHDHIRDIANFFSQVINDKADTTLVNKKVTELMTNYHMNKLKYCLPINVESVLLNWNKNYLSI